MKLENIKTNFKAVFHSVAKNYFIDNLIVKNVMVNGDENASSLILLNSAESSVEIKNINFNNNKNINKMECGNLYFENDVAISISDSIFTNNFSEGNGGVICIDNIYNLNLQLISNSFYKNKGKNGGALYIAENKNLNNINDTDVKINFENNIFKENIASDFGGAIYSLYNKLYLASTKNNSFTFNKAGLMGGGIYTPKSIGTNLFDFSDSLIQDNTVGSIINNYSTKPSYITLNTTFNEESLYINAGEYFPLVFNIFDEFGNIMIDINKYYSMIILKLEIIEKNEYNDNDDVINYYLLGNTGTFINEISINECNENQIKMINRRGIQYCENAKCKDNCPIKTSANCVPPKNISLNINDINLNKCECLPGWKGDNCSIKIYIDYK
ncbi:hypothetical protein PIROE2DRAFT_62167 [Piromyces sp. E2]|nr:hypothetical protein PIROE2DRAFT_62167 [Piromyces sp. E2]|eukprot:OUM61998.1 hypothetical protein PIROE2DRAFT_62167 [Piromyces sp. E2]